MENIKSIQEYCTQVVGLKAGHVLTKLCLKTVGACTDEAYGFLASKQSILIHRI